ncbi:alpha-L-arabinofuranosidase [Paenibacillus phyllosphaerae]|uniref:non-reducing end alpha-L-arabinofuranosidase n=1 Tax=Paenibacillus phyllosphaerae TaxID=274593 RepID=A0A7W5B2A0_9BACL|nr:LamG-like jellyroll fold domain-containing protein [Paenibacillus phyllosphaerae]MBB3112854.1 alpha-L-arabinofuranosidase [Paenibacillus phyllosphaerae]
MKRWWKKKSVRGAAVAGMIAAMCVTSLTPIYAEVEQGDASAAHLAAADDSLLLHYTFDQGSGTTASDASGHELHASLQGGAAWSTAGKTGGAIDLNGTNGYLKLPNGLMVSQHDVTISSWVYADTLSTWARVFDFGSSATNYMFLTLKNGDGNVRFGLRPEGSGETGLAGPPFPTSKAWQHIAFVISGNTYTLYINGIQVGSVSNMQLDPSDLGSTANNYIGRSQFSADPYFDGKLDDFRIYSRALSGQELVNLMTDDMSDSEMLAYDKNALDLGDTSQQTADLTFPVLGKAGSTIAWSSSDPAVVSADGKVTRPAAGQGDKKVTLTAKITNGTAQDTKTFTVIVWEEGSTAFTMNIDGKDAVHEVSPTLYGIFYEDINYAADGGLYGDLIQNRSFEFGTPLYSWTKKADGGGTGTLTTETANALNTKNPRYARIAVTTPGDGVGISNAGYSGGIAVQAGEKYNFTAYARSGSALTQPLAAMLRAADGTVIGACEASGVTAEWSQLGCSLQASQTVTNASFAVTLAEAATIDLDMVSLFPEKTWNNRANGLRYDLAEMLDDLNPGFLRFPGGCIVEGGSIENRYQWKNTIGDVAERKVQPNQWASNYYQSFGLGFQEYFQLAEDIGAEPLPIIFVGQVSCNSNPPKIPMDQLQPYIQDALDLIEYANGDVTTEWGAKRATNGHPEPFNMKYLGVGNELWGADYLARYNAFYEAIKAKYPDIKLVLSAGYAPNDTYFHQTYDWLESNGNKADLVDEHMYQSPDWFYNNVARYDNYDRSGPQVFVGEYAAHGTGKRNNMESALAEAAFMTGLERNSDVVGMASFAPLFARQDNTQWTTDLIWFNNNQSYATPNYHVQSMFSNHVGQQLMNTELKKNKPSLNDIAGSIALGSWNTAVEYDDVKVTKHDGSVLLNESFSNADALTGWTNFKGTWTVQNETLKQTSATTTDARLLLNTGADWSNYTVTLKARKTSGSEGFLIGFGSKDTNNYYWYNLGGWNNTQTVVEKAVGGTKSTISNIVTKGVETNRWYDIKVEVNGSGIRTYLDGQLVNEVAPTLGPLYSVTTKDEATGDLIVKVVNSSGNTQLTDVNVDAEYIDAKATVIELKSATAAAENSFSEPDHVAPVTSQKSGFGPSFTYEFPAYSVTVLRLRTTNDPVVTAIDPVSATTSIGQMPQLPSSVHVTLSDGSKASKSVAWSKLDNEQIAKTGMFSVKGTVAGTYVPAEASVRVQETQDGAQLSGPVSAKAGETVEVTYSLSGLDSDIYANDVTVNYDPEQLEFVSAEAAIDGFAVVGQSEPDESGAIRFLLAADQAGSGVSRTQGLLKLTFIVRSLSESTTTELTLNDVITADAQGVETNQPVGQPLQIELSKADTSVDKAELSALITQADTLHDQSIEGTKPGEYKAGSKTALKSAITAAQAVLDDNAATQQQVNAAVTELNAAIQTFQAAINVPKQGDFNNDGRYSIGDLGIIASHYGATSEDADWNTIKQADINNDGKIDIVDISAVAKLILQ